MINAEDLLITDEAIEKALQVLGLSGSTDDDIEKAVKKEKAQMPKNDGSDEDVKKTDMESDENEESTEEEGDEDDELEKACQAKEKELADLRKSMADKKAKKEAKKEPELPGLFDKQPKEETIKKSELADILKGVLNEMKDNSNGAIETLLGEINEIKKSNNDLKAEIARIGGIVPERKSFTKASVIEKSVTNDINGNGNTVFSKSIHKSEIADRLMVLSGVEVDKVNPAYANALIAFESTGEISKAIENDLLMNHKIQIVN